jgi:hypothetical protein
MPGTGWEEVVETALELQALFDELGYVSFPKTSGSKGVHVYLRIRPSGPSPRCGTRGGRWPASSSAAPRAGDREVVEGGARRAGLRRLQPDGAGPDDRLGVQRPGPAEATVSAPVTWAELPGCEVEDFDIWTMRERFAELGDVHAAIDDVQHDLTPLLELYERQGEGEAPYPPQFPKMEGEPLRSRPSVAGRQRRSGAELDAKRRAEADADAIGPRRGPRRPPPRKRVGLRQSPAWCRIDVGRSTWHAQSRAQLTGEPMAQYAVLIYANDSDTLRTHVGDTGRHDDHADDLLRGGLMLAAYALTPRDLATSVRAEGVHRWPFIDAKEIVAASTSWRRPTWTRRWRSRRPIGVYRDGGGVERPVHSGGVVEAHGRVTDRTAVEAALEDATEEWGLVVAATVRVVRDWTSRMGVRARGLRGALQADRRRIPANPAAWLRRPRSVEASTRSGGSRPSARKLPCWSNLSEGRVAGLRDETSRTRPYG